MAPVKALRAGSVALVLSPLLMTGCAGLHAYRPTAEVTQSRYTTIENYSNTPIDPDRVDAVLIQVASILKVRLDSSVPQPHIVVTTPNHIARLYEPHGGRSARSIQAQALYFPGTRMVFIPYFDRSLLGFVLAPYITEHYLTAPRGEWERMARSVAWKLVFTRERATGLRARAGHGCRPPRLDRPPSAAAGPCPPAPRS